MKSCGTRNRVLKRDTYGWETRNANGGAYRLVVTV